jgi:Tripartite tricarboxylate transporter TctB family
MSTDAQTKNYWREEFALVALLFVVFAAVVLFALNLPFDAKLFPMIIGAAGILLGIAIAVQEWRRRAATAPVDVVSEDDPAANATWPRYATALLAAPVFGVVFFLFGFFVASFAAMFVMPPLMGYSNRRMTILVGLATVAVLAVFFPHLVGVNLPHGLVGDWLIDRFQSH